MHRRSVFPVSASLAVALAAALGGCHLLPPAYPECGAGPPDQVAGEILAARGLARVHAYLPASEVTAQSALPGDVCFGAAVRAAVESLLEAADDAESPAAIAAHVDGDPCAFGPPAHRLACFVDRGDAMFALVARDRRRNHQDGVPLPPRRESVRRHWVFALSIPALSDHVYWIVVPRRRAPDGSLAVYNYGFN
jgi:hypothetical protein